MQIRYYRIKNKLSQEELALKIGVSKSALCKWEKDIRYPSLKNIRKLESIFKVSLHEGYYTLPEIGYQDTEDCNSADASAEQPVKDNLAIQEAVVWLLKTFLGGAKGMAT